MPSSRTPKEMLELAASARAATKAARDAMSAGSSPRAELARRQTALDARRVRPALGALRMPARSEWVAAAQALAKLCEQAGRAAEDAARFDLGGSRWAREMLQRLDEGLAALEAALKTWPGPACEDELAFAKRAALEIERLHRGARREAMDDPQMVRGLQSGAVGRRLSDAADALHEAAEAVAGALAARQR